MATPLRIAALIATCLVVVVGLTLLQSTAFAEEEPAAPPKAKEVPETKEAEKKEAKASATPVVKLVSNGAEPRRALRYAPTAGNKLDFFVSTTSVPAELL